MSTAKVKSIKNFVPLNLNVNFLKGCTTKYNMTANTFSYSTYVFYYISLALHGDTKVGSHDAKAGSHDTGVASLINEDINFVSTV